MTADSRVSLRWSGRGLEFAGSGASGREITVDSDGRAGPSPTEALLLSLAGCMAVDVKMILDKSRVPLDSLEVTVEGDRAREAPRRFTAVRVLFSMDGPSEGDGSKIRRALDLSRDKYCSVLHTLRRDLDLELETEIRRG